MKEYLVIGKIIKVVGLKGELKVYPSTDFSSLRFKKGTTIYLGEEKKEFEIKNSRNITSFPLIILKDYEDINLVQKFHSEDIYVSSEDRKSNELAKGEYYHSDLIGMKVLNTLGEDRGVVTGIRELPQADCLEINYNGKKCFVLFMDQFIDNVIDDKIIVKEIEGLFWK